MGFRWCSNAHFGGLSSHEGCEGSPEIEWLGREGPFWGVIGSTAAQTRPEFTVVCNHSRELCLADKATQRLEIGDCNRHLRLVVGIFVHLRISM